jgi:hypothetical protein
MTASMRSGLSATLRSLEAFWRHADEQYRSSERIGVIRVHSRPASSAPRQQESRYLD